jgi:hypothetical protein
MQYILCDTVYQLLSWLNIDTIGNRWRATGQQLSVKFPISIKDATRTTQVLTALRSHIQLLNLVDQHKSFIILCVLIDVKRWDTNMH